MIAKINRIMFPCLVGLSFFLIILESYKYTGFLAKYIHIDVKTILVIVLVSSLLVAERKLTALSNLIFKINIFILPASLVVYFLMQYLEATNFLNYVFSKYHFQPAIFIYVVFLSLALLLVSCLNKKKFFLQKVSVTERAVVLVFIIIFIDGITGVVNMASYRDVYILTHIHASYDSKMREKLGTYYDYIKFVKMNTPESARILTPPMQGPWYSSGNVGMNRYFLFPRNLGNGTYNSPMDLTKYDHVLLAWGEWGIDESDFAWPKIFVKAEKVIYFDPVTNIMKEIKGNYDPDLSRKNGIWGIIKLNK
jgi:hypothetical protein